MGAVLDATRAESNWHTVLVKASLSIGFARKATFDRLPSPGAELKAEMSTTGKSGSLSKATLASS